jgi:hypothetical protein
MPVLRQSVVFCEAAFDSRLRHVQPDDDEGAVAVLSDRPFSFVAIALFMKND